MLQHVDKNIGPNDYRHLKESELLVTKVFLTLQSEGPFSGTPAVFIRLAGCNKGDKISCPWCDTYFNYDTGQVTSVTELVADVKAKFAATHHMVLSAHPQLVILTGGEPMIQDNVVRLIEALHQAHFAVQIESNGDRLAREFLANQACRSAKLVVSPKIIPSTKRYRRLVEDVFTRTDYLKFVVEANPVSPYRELPTYIFEWCMYTQDPGRVFVSPLTSYNRAVEPNEIASVWTEGLINKEETARNYAHAGAMCVKYGYRFSMQQHLYIGVE